MAEALRTGAILAELAAILADHSQTLFKDRADLTPEKRSGRWIHSFLAQLESGLNAVPGLEWVTVVRVDPYVRAHHMHLLFSVQFDLHSTH